MAEAEVDLGKTVVRAGVDGRVEQFLLRVGDIVNPMLRPAGVLIPESAGQRGLQAGFNQIEAQIMKPGMTAEVTCVSKPWTIIPMVVTDVQDYIAAGQFRGGEQLIDAQQVRQPGTLLAFLEPLYQGGLEGVSPEATASPTRIPTIMTSLFPLIPARCAVWRSMRSMRLGSCTLCCCGFRRCCSPSRRLCSAVTDRGAMTPAATLSSRCCGTGFASRFVRSRRMIETL